MDITRKGWKCDCCEKEYFEGDCGYAAKYTVTIDSNSAINSNSGTYTDVCFNCIDSIMEILEPANIQ